MQLCYCVVMKSLCPLCRSIITFTSASSFAHCIHCDAYSKDPYQFLNNTDEKNRYLLHDNTLDNPGYIQFLTPLAQLIQKHVKQDSLGLDYGCGPVFALEKTLNYFANLNHYDLYFHPNKDVFNTTYDFIVLSEVIEHLKRVDEVINRCLECLKPQGMLFIQTQRHDEVKDIDAWYYAKEPTHLFFLSLQTFDFIASQFQLDIIDITPRIVVLKKR